MVYVGTACAIVLIRISFPAFDNNFSFRLDNLLFSSSINWWKVSYLSLSMRDRGPKYFYCCFIIYAPKQNLTSSWTSWGVFLLKNIEVFSWFNCWHEACSYFSKIDIKVEYSSFVSWQKIKLSSIKNKWEILGPLAHATTPFSVPSFMDFPRSAKRPFTHSNNN